MSDDALRDAIARMATDAAFRTAIESGEADALDGLDLTPSEIAMVRSLSSEGSPSPIEDLEPRLSKSSIFTGGTLSALHVHDTGTELGAPEGSTP